MKKNSIFCNAAWNIGSLVCNLLLVFFCTPIIIRELGEASYGVYVILGSIGGILSIASLGMGEATLKYVSEYVTSGNHLEVRKVFTSTFLLYSTIGLGLSIVLFTIPSPFVKLLKIDQVENATFLFRITAVIFWVHLMNGSVSSIPAAVQRYEFASFVSFIQNLLQFILVILAIRLGYGLRGLMCVTLGNALLILPVNFTLGKYLIPYLGFSWPGKAGFRKVFRYGLTIFASRLIGLLWQYSDHILLSSMIGPQAVGIFSVPRQTIGKGIDLINAGMAVLFPHFSSLSSDFAKNKEEIISTYVMATQLGLMASIALCVPLSIMLPDFLRLWISVKFSENASLIATILASCYVIRGASLAYDALFKGLGYPKYIFYYTLTSSLSIFLVDIISIPLWGINGIGLSYIISFSIDIVVILFVFKRLLIIPMLVFWRDLVVPYAIAMIVLVFGLLLRSKDFWPHAKWYSFLVISATLFVLNLIAVLGVGRFFGTDFKFFRLLRKD